MCTFNVLSIPNFEPFLKWVLELRAEYQNRSRVIHLDIPNLRLPTLLNVEAAPESLHSQMESHLQFMKKHQISHNTHVGFTEGEVFKMERILELMRAPKDSQWVKTARKNFYLLFSEHDRRRGTDFLSTFPELEDYWNHCRQLCGK